MTVGAAAALLDTLAAVEPLHFASFYERTRLYGGSARPAPPEVVLDLTQDCPLTCTFCLAGATRGGGLRISDAVLAHLETELTGVPKVLVVGGEPLTHPEINAILKRLRSHHADVEVVTGGVTLPPDPKRFAAWLQRHTEASPDAGRLTLTLSVDQWHRDAVGTPLFSQRIDRMLELADRSPPGLSVRFLVTDPALPTAGYLQRRDIDRCLTALHPGLAAHFDRAWRDREVDAWFRFGPVVRLGEAAHMAAEPLDAADMAWAGEVVLSPRTENHLSSHSPDNALGHSVKLLRGLPATWMAAIPEGLVHRSAESGPLADRLLHGVIADALGLNDHPGLRHAFLALHHWRLGSRELSLIHRSAAARELAAIDRQSARTLAESLNHPEQSVLARAIAQHAGLATAEQWPSVRHTWLQAAAQRLDAVCTPELAWQFGVDRPQRRVHFPVVRQLWQLRAARDPAFAAMLAEELVGACLRPLQAGGWPVFVGYLPRQGLLSDRPDVPLPIREAPLDMGVATPYFGDALVHPRLVVRTGFEPPLGRPVVLLDGLGAAPVGAGEEDQALSGLRQLAIVLAQLTPESLRGPVEANWREALLALAEHQTEPNQPAHQAKWPVLLQTCASEPLPHPPQPQESPAEVERLVDNGRAHRWSARAASRPETV